MQSHRLDIHTIDSDDAFRALREEWNELLRNSRSDTLFLTWEWLYCWWRHLGDARRPAIRTVRDGDTLVGIAPLIGSAGLIPSLELMGTGCVGSDYLDVIARRHFEGSVLTALASELRAHGRLLTLLNVPAEGSALAELALRLDESGWTHTFEEAGTCPFIDLSGHDWNSYLATLSSSHRYNFRRRCRNLERDHDVSFARPTSVADCGEALEILVELHRKRWRERGGSDALHRPELVAFHRELVPLALENGWLRLYVLRLDGQPAAALYGFHYDDRFLFYQSGFDPAFARQSPSLVTLGLTIRDAVREGAREYDFLHGDERYKFHWASRQRSLVRLECHPPGIAAAAVRHGRRLAGATKHLARQLLPEPVTTALSNFKERVS